METTETPPKIDLGPVIQVGMVVRDAEATARAWTDRFNFGPAKTLDWPPEGSNLQESSTYRGERGNFKMRLAFIETPSIQIEFIQPLEGGSVYAEFLEQHGGLPCGCRRAAFTLSVVIMWKFQPKNKLQ